MIIDRISRSKSYEMVTPFGLKIWDKLGVEAQLAENEDPKEGYETLGRLIDETHKENAKQWEDVPVQYTQPTNPATSMLDAINSCEDIKVLESYRLIAKSNPELQIAYDKKLEELEK